MLNIAICDDDIKMAGDLEDILFREADFFHIQMDVDIFRKGKRLVEAVDSGIRYDLIYLEFETKEWDGISVARKIRQFDTNSLIVYVSRHVDHVAAALDVRPFRFLEKPINERVFERYFLDCLGEIAKENWYFRYKYQKIYYQIPVGDIIYFESRKRKIRVVMAERETEIYGKLDEIQEYMDKGKTLFLRVHQSFLVNYAHIRKMTYNHVDMDNKIEIPISAKCRAGASERYIKMGEIYHM